MASKKAFILGAGYGMRMGKIGRVLPKVLWPIFEKTILELLILYLKEIGVDRIFINTHHQHEAIKSFVEEKNLDVEILHEKELLGSGGCFHNFKKKVGDDKILAVNGDQFFFFEGLHRWWYDISAPTLFAHKTEGDYRELVVRDKLLVDIRYPEEKTRPHPIFTGVSVIDLKEMEYKEGESQYFPDIVDFKKSKVHVLQNDRSIYYDFGSKERYIRALQEIVRSCLNHEIDEFIDFLYKNKALDSSKLGRPTNSYGSNKKNEIKMGSGFTVTDKMVRYGDLEEAVQL